MPKCLNDPKKFYKGTEPSPKGLGYCAGGMKVGEKKKGKDGNMWFVKKVKNGSKRWIKERMKGSIKEKVKVKKIVKYKYNLKYNFKPSKKDKEIIQNSFSYGVHEDILKLLNIPINKNKMDIFQGVVTIENISKKEIDNIIKKLKEKDFQNKIIKVITKKIPKSLIDDYQVRVGNVDKDVIEKAIRQFINNRYNEGSIFDFDISYIYNSKGKDWSALTDTSPRESIMENIYLFLTGKKKVETNFFKFFPVK
jgi:hypothetical protein